MHGEASDGCLGQRLLPNHVNVTRSLYQLQRQDDAFNKFYESVVKNAQDLQIGESMLPQYRRAPL